MKLDDIIDCDEIVMDKSDKRYRVFYPNIRWADLSNGVIFIGNGTINIRKALYGYEKIGCIGDSYADSIDKSMFVVEAMNET